MKNYDTYLFIDIIESQPNVIFLRQNEINNIRARCYQGVTGKLVIIDISEENIDDDTGIGHLLKLGLGDLIPALYPIPKEEKTEQLTVHTDKPEKENPSS